jgi:phospholipase/carboxylesterase
MLTHQYISSTLEYPPTIVLLHGYGADEHDLLTVAQMISDEYQIISLRAPIALPWGGYAWYQIYQTPIGFRSDDKSRHQSYLMLSETIIELDSQYAIASKPFIVLGFSQGAVMSYSLSLD